MVAAKAELHQVQMAPLLCLLANVHRDPKRTGRPYKIEEFLPRRTKPRRRLRRRDVDAGLDGWMRNFPKAY